VHRSYALIPALTAALFAVPMVALDAPLAHADRGIHVSGGVRASGRVNVRFGGVRVRPHRRVIHRGYGRSYAPPPRPVHIYTGGSVYWGGGFYYGPRFAEPPPPPPPPAPPPPAHDCACDVGYGYDYGYGYGAPPPQPMAAPPMGAPSAQPVIVAAPRAYAPPLPRLGIGVYAGSVDIDGRTQGGELGLFGRLRLTEKLYVEAEVAQAEMTNSHIDNRAGASLLFDFSPRSRFSLNVLGGVGLTQTESNDTFEDKSYGEIGLGLTYRPTQRFQIAADIRGGARSPVEQDFESSDGSSDIEEEGFYRSRLSAMVFF
jgi:hypothetical protein